MTDDKTEELLHEIALLHDRIDVLAVALRQVANLLRIMGDQLGLPLLEKEDC